MRELLRKRILFFGGKGGVGKTTCASAMALGASRAGKRVLLVSTDPAHSTSDIFEKPFDGDEREIYPGLTGIELDANLEARRYVDKAKAEIARMFSPAVAKEAERQIDLASAMPGVEEVALFDRMSDLIIDRFDAYDLLIFPRKTVRNECVPVINGFVHGRFQIERTVPDTVIEAVRETRPLAIEIYEGIGDDRAVVERTRDE